jgi:peptidoglycan/LPS O-acetylase OafA/YrhL
MKPVKQIYPLTSLRFFAAFCVVLHHTIEGVAPALASPGWLNRLQRYSGVTVLLFFILSGYVLAVVYLEQGRPVEKKCFWLARFARIYPLYFVTLVLDTPNLYHYRLLKYGTKAALLKTSISFAGSALLLQQWFLRLSGIDFPNWSLSVEAFFFLVFPVFGARLWRLRLATQCILAASLFLGLPAVQFVDRLCGVDLFDYLQPVSYLPYFMSGIVLYRIQLRIRQDTARLARWQRVSPWLALLSVAVLATVCAAPRRFSAVLLPGFLFLPGFSLILLCFSVGNRWIEAVFSWPALVLLGEASYSLYLLHVIVWTWVFGYAQLPLNVTTYLLYLAAAILLSIASFRFLEVPARRRLLRAWHQRSPEPEAIASIAQ